MNYNLCFLFIHKLDLLFVSICKRCVLIITYFVAWTSAQIQYAQLQVCAINKCATKKVRKFNVRNCNVRIWHVRKFSVRKVGLLEYTNLFLNTIN